MRGTGSSQRPPRRSCRFIPAHAGNRGAKGRRIGVISVHPRACGEQGEIRTSIQCPSGSSPRMRGTGHRGHHRKSLSRFIPAHAGNRNTGPPTGSGQAVHPRACGEQAPRALVENTTSGSSPRMRGTASSEARKFTMAWFIPAHAGNRAMSIETRRATSVHPRACGEQMAADEQAHLDAGSSPRMRGTGYDHDQIGSAKRFIPAHAGNRSLCVTITRAPPVHPRACGEQS